VQQWLNAWMAGDTAAKIAMLEPETQPGSTVPDPQLLSGKINDYEPYQHSQTTNSRSWSRSNCTFRR
jgi:hypothetical protein